MVRRVLLIVVWAAKRWQGKDPELSEFVLETRRAMLILVAWIEQRYGLRKRARGDRR